ncbi:hypothetical protein IB223_16240 [Pseudoxanthomonas sp. PXM03]|uniref:hypothetical protein n=1 Tax=Pseudoxanthomonas sp. PXM03 TaxID=2769284 RepID=UPI00177D68D9|nr:hypothetical protein [Pseudoxanthomonas sp. PXM03]MBD9437647.1 hypothetical protein [Pseudoxanthomonas sp. PXM03]
MESSLQIGRWSIRFDPELTRQLYARTSSIACDCMDCVNFRASGERAFPPAFLRLLQQFGIDPGKPAELCHYGTSGEPMPTQGWFHFVGHLDGGADAWRQTSETTHVLDAEPFPGMKSVGFTVRLSQVPDPFEGQPLVQLEFESVVPWVAAGSLA